MSSKAYRHVLLAAVVMGAMVFGLPAMLKMQDSPALAAAMKNVPTTLEKGLQASERTGKPISAKFEVEDGKLQLSIYTMKRVISPRSSWHRTVAALNRPRKSPMPTT